MERREKEDPSPTLQPLGTLVQGIKNGGKELGWEHEYSAFRKGLAFVASALPESEAPLAELITQVLPETKTFHYHEMMVRGLLRPTLDFVEEALRQGIGEEGRSLVLVKLLRTIGNNARELLRDKEGRAIAHLALRGGLSLAVDALRQSDPPLADFMGNLLTETHGHVMAEHFPLLRAALESTVVALLKNPEENHQPSHLASLLRSIRVPEYETWSEEYDALGLGLEMIPATLRQEDLELGAFYQQGAPWKGVPTRRRPRGSLVASPRCGLPERSTARSGRSGKAPNRVQHFAAHHHQQGRALRSAGAKWRRGARTGFGRHSP